VAVSLSAVPPTNFAGHRIRRAAIRCRPSTVSVHRPTQSASWLPLTLRLRQMLRGIVAPCASIPPEVSWRIPRPPAPHPGSAWPVSPAWMMIISAIGSVTRLILFVPPTCTASHGELSMVTALQTEPFFGEQYWKLSILCGVVIRDLSFIPGGFANAR
jgi:hypothetical protein